MTSDPADFGPDSGPDGRPESGPDSVPDALPDSRPAAGPGHGSGQAGGSEHDRDEPQLDVDAAFAEIVARWEPSTPGADEPEPGIVVRRESVSPAPVGPGRVESAEDGAVDEDGPVEHFVPPPPPPLPAIEPRRKLAWAGLVGAPVLALLFITLGVVVPGWVALGMVAAFVGGFGYLVATMSSTPTDPWSGDDGAIL